MNVKAERNDEHQQDNPSSLADCLEADTTGELAEEILHRLHEMQTRLEREKQKLQHPETYRAILAGLGAIEGAESVMQMYIASKL
jgi:hypothetical protein